MRQSPLIHTALAALLCACAGDAELLNSERIEQQFGSYGVEVLFQQSDLRRSSLYSVDGGTRVCRTYAVVRFATPREPSIDAPHANVLAGGSLGATFRKFGWNVNKQTLHVGSLYVSDAGHPVAELMQLDSAQQLAMHIYRLQLVRHGTTVDYATVAELHHPDYLDEAALRGLYGPDAGDSSVAAPIVVEFRRLILESD